jgi:hypothetical protein
MSTIARLPDDHVVYVPGVGETTVGSIRGSVPEDKPAVDDPWEATLLMWERRVTRGIRSPLWRKHGGTRSGRRA